MNYSTNSRDKLHAIFMDRYMELQRGCGFSPKECKEIERRWESYLSGMGCSVQGWVKAMGHEGVMIRNPCDNTVRLHANNPSITTYIFMPAELATKILVLGGLP